MNATRRLLLTVLAVLVVAGVAYAQSTPRGAVAGAACMTVSLAVVVDLDNTRHANLLAHERSALAGGHPRILHIDRVAADAHRAASLKGIPTRPGFDRDEYPPAVAGEGGAGADVAYVPSAENRSGGAVMSHQLLPFCDGQAFVIEP